MGSLSIATIGAVAVAASSLLARRVASLPTMQREATCVALKAAFDPTKAVGVTAPLGYWDPCDLMHDKTGAWKDEKIFYQYRAAELKHGRIAMLAVLGMVAGTFAKWPGFEGVDDGFAALSSGQGGAGFGILFIIAGVVELKFWKQDPSKEPGDFGDPCGFMKITPAAEYSVDMRNRELNHGRLAMFGAIGELFTEYATGKGPAGQFEYVSQLSNNAVLPVFFLLVAVWTGSAVSKQGEAKS